MPNPFHFRARIDRLWRRSGDHNPGYIRLKALDAVVRELFAPNDRARRNYRMYLATDPFDVARHLLRDLYDHANPAQGEPAAATTEVAPAQAGAAPAHAETARQDRESSDEEDDPL